MEKTQNFSNDSRYSLKLILTEQTTVVESNTSPVYYKMSLIKSSGSGYYTSMKNNPVYLSINNQVIKDENIAYDFSTSTPCEIVVAEGIINVEHDDDGNKKMSYSASFTDNDNGRGSASISGTLDLSFIARASTVGANDSDIGSTTTIVINRKSDTFKHTLRWKCSTLSGTIVTKTSNQTVAWTVPTSLYALIPDDLSIKVTVYCDTYSDDTLIGTKETTFKARVNEDDNKPTVSVTLEDINSKTYEITQDSSKLIKFFSNVKTIITATVKNSATIKSYKVVCADGKSATGQTTTIKNVESGTFNIYVTDSRGLVTNLKKTLTIDPYVKLTLNAEVKRVSATGSNVKVSVEGNFYVGSTSEKGSWATLSLMYRYKEKGATTWSGYTEIASNVNYSKSSSDWNNYYLYDYEISGEFDYQKQYDFEFIASDNLMSVTSNQVLKVGQPNHWWNKDKFTHNTDVYLKSGNMILDYEVIDEW